MHIIHTEDRVASLWMGLEVISLCALSHHVTDVRVGSIHYKCGGLLTMEVNALDAARSAISSVMNDHGQPR